MYSTLDIVDYAHGGYGVSKLPSGKVALVEGAIPSEKVCASITLEKKDYAICKVEDVLEPSKDRVSPICSNYAKCGGCNLMHMSYALQVKLKNKVFTESIKSVFPEAEISEPITSFNTNYRSRARFKYSVKSKKVQLFFSEENSTSLVPISSCPVCDIALNDFLASPPFLNPWELKDSQLSCISTDAGVLYHPSKASAITISTELSGTKKLFVSNQVFFQSNLLLLPKLIDLIGKNIIGETVLDLYSGVGTFSAFLEDKYSIYSVEINKYCLELAKKNLKHAKFITSPVQDLKTSGFNADSVIVDPPRTGLDVEVPNLISSFNPKRIIYVSCFLPTLIRDLKAFKHLGFTVQTATMLDFYPHTPHLETVVMMSRVGN